MQGMIKDKKTIIILLSVFFAIELALWVAIQHTFGLWNTVLCYSAIALAFLLLWLSFEKSFDFLFTAIALFGTLMADLFLVVIEPMHQLPAMIFFSVTQLAYFARILTNTKNKTVLVTHIITRCTLSVIAVAATAAVLGSKTDAVALVSLFYFANLIVNVVFAFVNFKRDCVLAIGLLLFLLCDFFVGMSMMGDYIAVNEGSILYFLAHPGFNAAWLFYVPSQALLASSILLRRLCRK